MKRKIDIKNLTDIQLIKWLKKYNIESYRAEQIQKWIYLKHAEIFDDMTDIKKSIRSLLSDNFSIKQLEKQEVRKSDDGTTKYLFRLIDNNFIETVLIPEKSHYTLCISSQVGCGMGCKFCMTGKIGFIRNLRRGEIIEQIINVKNDIKESDKKLTNIVFMGSGEPLANYYNVTSAIPTITDSDIGLGFSKRKVTLSTVGVVPKIDKLSADIEINLAISLNATDDENRSRLMPINKKYPIDKLLSACKRYVLKPRQRITFEYVLLKDINDSKEDAIKLVRLLKDIKAKVNIIPFNEHMGAEFKRPNELRINEFREILLDNNLTVIIRNSKGSDIAAACGQLMDRYFISEI